MIEKRLQTAVSDFLSEKYKSPAQIPSVTEVLNLFVEKTGEPVSRGTVHKAIQQWKAPFEAAGQAIIDKRIAIARANSEDFFCEIWKIAMPAVTKMIEAETAKLSKELEDERSAAEQANEIADQATELRDQAQAALTAANEQIRNVQDELEHARQEIHSLTDRLRDSQQREQILSKERDELRTERDKAIERAHTIEQMNARLLEHVPPRAVNAE